MKVVYMTEGVIIPTDTGDYILYGRDEYSSLHLLNLIQSSGVFEELAMLNEYNGEEDIYGEYES